MCWGVSSHVRKALAITLVVALTASLLAGCLAGERASVVGSLEAASTAAPPPPAAPRTGEAEAPTTVEIRGVVADATLKAIAGASVAHGETGKVARTDAQGAFAFSGLEPGTHTLSAEADGFHGAALRATLAAGDAWEPVFRLEPVIRPVPYDERFELAGFFECSATYLIVAGDCFAAADFVADALGLPRPGNATNEKFAFEIPVAPGWESIVVEERWDPGAGGLDPKLSLLVERLEFDEEGHGVSYAETGGESPLRLDIRRGEVHATAQSQELRISDDGETIRVRSFVEGELHRPGGTGFLGVGAAFQQRFTIYVTVFYLAPAPDGFAIVGGGA